VSYAPLFIDRTVTVIGDSDLALKSAAELALVAKHVNLVGPTQPVLESPLGNKLNNAENVSVYKDYELVEVRGGSFAESVLVQSPTGSQQEIFSDGAFIEQRLNPNTGILGDLVNLDEKGQIIVDCQARTSTPGIFAAGDVTTTAEQVLIAIGEGAKAALSAYDYLLPRL
jgi:alkyl hydroperoxide reductase subunit AhpF